MTIRFNVTGHPIPNELASLIQDNLVDKHIPFDEIYVSNDGDLEEVETDRFKVITFNYNKFERRDNTAFLPHSSMSQELLQLLKTL